MLNYGPLLGLVGSVLAILAMVGTGLGVFLTQLRHGGTEASAALITEQNQSIAYLEGELKREREHSKEAEAKASAVRQHNETLRADNDQLRKLVRLEAVPPALQKALEAQADRIIVAIKDSR